MAASRGGVVLKTVKKVVVKFCPFESNVRSTREFLAVVGTEKARSTNLSCEVTSDVKHDKSDPIIDITFADGEKLVMKGANLTSKEMLSAFTSRCTAKDPQAQDGKKK
ncbi:39S ribosomal protein L53 [Huso huso]|uniref:Large ribosomal subunit protein mL53 n=2 Tax=Acipenseridae TaxID=7900 RepID=A0A444TZY2_ACIRT|nr:39S ribosomal protein L53, mitochondrial [Acipenser ruthenus]RXM28474.1 39S ribosomal protein L53, mitochondrial [Acipenser ruthenus]